MKITRFFVYGTLKPGYGNYPIIEPYVISAEKGIVQGYTLINLRLFPMAVLCADAQVKGIVLHVRAAANVRVILDKVEGHPNFYHRIIVRVNNKLAYMYVGQPHENYESIGDSWGGKCVNV